MKQKKVMLSVLMLVAGMSTHAFSQKGTVAAGGDASGAGGGVIPNTNIT